MACPVGGLHAVHHHVVLQRQKLSKGEGAPQFTHASPGTVWRGDPRSLGHTTPKGQNAHLPRASGPSQTCGRLSEATTSGSNHFVVNHLHCAKLGERHQQAAAPTPASASYATSQGPIWQPSADAPRRSRGVPPCLATAGLNSTRSFPSSTFVRSALLLGNLDKGPFLGGVQPSSPAFWFQNCRTLGTATSPTRMLATPRTRRLCWGAHY